MISLGAAQSCWNFGCLPEDLECAEVGAAFLGFFGDPACFEAFANGELNGLPENASIQPNGPNAGQGKHMGDVICTSVAQCGFCGAAASVGVCRAQCM